MASSTTPSLPLLFSEGGTIRAGCFYVERAADKELLSHLRNGDVCSVLAPRQIGKSSLCARAAERLRAEGVKVVSVQVTEIGRQDATELGWYVALARIITRELALDLDTNGFLMPPSPAPLSARFAELLREIVRRAPGRMVIMLDEIDAILERPAWTDDFVDVIRALASSRGAEPDLTRLTFCLIGFAIGGELYHDPTRGPFNVDVRIALQDFTRNEVNTLLPGLEAYGDRAPAILDAIMGWTHGHPYMTMRLCAEVVRAEEHEAEPEDLVKRATDKLFLLSGIIEDANIKFARNYLSLVRHDAPIDAIIALYRKVLEAGEQGIPSDPTSRAESHLWLSGAARLRADKRGERALCVRNRIYREVLGLRWVEGREKELGFDIDIQRWLKASPADKEKYLLRGEALTRFEESTKRKGDPQSKVKQGFLAASQEAARKEAEQQKALAERERAAAKTVTRAVAAIAVFLTVSLSLVIWQYTVARRAEEIQRAAALSEREAKKKAQFALRAEQGARADILTKEGGNDVEALLLGIRAVVGDHGDIEAAPPQAVQGLASTALRGRLAFYLEGERPEYSHDGSRIFTRGPGTWARLWDAREGTLIGSLNGLFGEVVMAVFSPDDIRIATVSKDPLSEFRDIHLWDGRSGALVAHLWSRPADVIDARFSSDGATLVTLDNEPRIYVWDLRAHYLLRDIPVQCDQIDYRIPILRTTDDASRALTRCWIDGVSYAHLWDLTKGELIKTIRADAVDLSKNGKFLATSSKRSSSRDIVLHLRDKNGEVLDVLRGHDDNLDYFEFSPNDRLLLARDVQWNFAMWDIEQRKIVNRDRGLPHFFAHKGVDIVFSHNPTRIKHADSTDNSWSQELPAGIRGGQCSNQDHVFTEDNSLWDNDGPDDYYYRQAYVPSTVGHHGYCISPIEHQAAADESDAERTSVWNLRRKPWVRTINVLPSASAAQYGPGNLIAAVAGLNEITVYEAETYDAKVEYFGEPPQELSEIVQIYPTRYHVYGEKWHLDRCANLIERRSPHFGVACGKHFTIALNSNGEQLSWVSDVDKVAFLPDGKLAVAVRGESVKIVGAEVGEDIFALRTSGGDILSLDYSPDGTSIAAVTSRGLIHQWSAQSGELIRTLDLGGRREPGFASVEFSPHGDYIIGRREEAGVRYWSAQDGRLLSDGDMSLYMNAISSNDKRAIKYERNSYELGRIELWKLPERELVAEFRGDDFRFSPDGSYFIVSYNLSVEVRRAEDATLISTLHGQSSKVGPFLFSHDGRLLAGIGSDSVYLWRMSDQALLATLPARLALGSIQFSPNDRHILTLDYFNKAGIYPTTIQGFLSLACQRLRRFPAEYAEVAQACAPYVDREP